MHNPLKSKKKIYVSSVVYNLSGEPNERPNYLPTALYGAVMNQTSEMTVSNGIQRSYIGGPATKYKSWYRWVRDNMQAYMKLPQASIGSAVSIPTSDIITALNLPAGESAWVQTAIKDDADYMWWAQQYMIRNQPTLVNTDWAADFESSTGIMNITLANGTTLQVAAAGYVNNADYIYAQYTKTQNAVVGPMVPGTMETDLPVEPSHEGFTVVSEVPSAYPLALKTTTTVKKEYANGMDTTTTTTESTDNVVVNDMSGKYERDTYQGQQAGSDSLTSLAEFLYVWRRGTVVSTTSETVTNTSENIGGTIVDVKVTTTTVKEEIKYVYDRRLDTQTTTQVAYKESDIFIYRLGSGGFLDKYIGAKADFGEFFPILPIRIDNDSINSYGYLTFQNGKLVREPLNSLSKAYKKLMGSEFSKIVSSVQSNKDIKQIDYACMNFGVSLNTTRDSCKRYVYEFFRRMIAYQTSSQSDYLAWKTRALQAATFQNRWDAWKAAQSNPADPLYGTAEPTRSSIAKPNSSSINIKGPQEWSDWYDITISWNYISETVGAGQAWPGAQVGELRLAITEGNPILVNMYVANSGGSVDSDDLNDDVLTIYWQTTATSYRVLNISGAYHKNKVYKGKSVGTSAKDALKDKDESGFIVPLHYGVLSSLGMVHSTQVTSECGYITFNCYQVVKQRWYQSGWFKIVLVAVVIIISIWTGGAAAGAGAGVLGANAAVGAAIGLAGTAAIVAGAIANALAAMVISAVIMKASTSLLGDKVGAIVGAIASMVAMNVAAGYQATGNVAVNWGDMATASNALKATEAIQQSYQAYAVDKMKDIQKQSREMQEYFENKSEEIQDKFKELMGYTGAVIDPMMFTEAAGNTPHETAANFLSRTLMTGSDIAAMTHNMIGQFATLSMDLDLIKVT